VSPQEQMQRIIPLLFPTNWLKANPDYTDYLPIPKELVSLDVMGKQANASVEWHKGVIVTLFQISPSLL
jgi:hypothetical protein